MKRWAVLTLLFLLTACQPATATPTATLNEDLRGGPERDPLAIKETATAVRSTQLAETAAAPTPFTPPPPSETVPIPTKTLPPGAEHISGSIELAGGLCCAGGVTGEDIEVPVTLTATSTAGAITDMRMAYRYASIAFDLETAEWQPYTEQTSLPIELISNWVGLEACVQFRDAAGNTSAVYCDDISVEGMPRAPDPEPFIADQSTSPNGEWQAVLAEGIFLEGQEYWQYNVENLLNGVTWDLGEGEVNDVPIQGYEFNNTYHWSKDGQYLYFARYSTGGDGCFINPYRGLKRVHLPTGDIEEILAKGWPSMAISPDDTSLAFIDWSDNGLMLLDLESLERVEYSQLIRPEDFDEPYLGILKQGNIVWSPDSEFILYTVEVEACFQLITSIIRVDIINSSQTLLIDQDDNYYHTVEWPEADQAVVRSLDSKLWWMDTMTGKILEPYKE